MKNISDREKQIRAIREELEKLKQAVIRLTNIFRKGGEHEKDYQTESGRENVKTD